MTEIEVDDPGLPDLQEGEPEPAPTPAAVPPEASGWTPEEAAQVAAQLVTLGLWMTYSARWRALPPEALEQLGVPGSELPQLGRGLAPILDRFLPKTDTTGLALMGLGLMAGVVEVGHAVARRAPLLAKRPPERPAPERPAPAEQTPREPQPQPSGEGQATATWRMPVATAALVERRDPTRSYQP